MSAVIKEYLKIMPYVLAKPNVESDVYNNCLLIQKCVSNLQKSGLLSRIEEDVLVAFFQGFNFSEISRLLAIDRKTVLAVLNKVTDRVAYILGGEFSDASLLIALEERGFRDSDYYPIISKKENK